MTREWWWAEYERRNPPTREDLAYLERWRMQQKAARERYNEHIARGGKGPGMCATDLTTQLVIV